MTFSPLADQFANFVPLATAVSAKSPQPSHSPAILDTLFRNCGFRLEQVSRLIDPILTARSLCQQSSFYMQGIMVEDQAFLSTNLFGPEHIHVTLCARSWVLGSSSRCAIAIPHPSLSACHAVLSHDPAQGFFLADVGSQQGTWVNRRRLVPAQRHYLDDGDLIELGSLRVEFFQELALPLDDDNEGLADYPQR